jgi:integrase
MNQGNFDQKLTREQLLKLLARAKAGKQGDRDHLMILLGVCHGLRASEICDLRVDDFDLDEGVVTIRRKKGSRKTTQQLASDLEPLLDEATATRQYLEGRHGKLFDIGRKMFHILMRKYSSEVGIPKRLRHPHVLKHSAAHFAIESSGKDLVAVQNFLGHVSLQSTGIYLEISDAEASRRVRKNFFGRG